MTPTRNGSHMPKQLTTLNATITTAAVEVKTLTISGKQVTLAVFRQLLEEPLLHPLDATIEGTPWGRVNYHPDKCGDAPEHLHVVWQKGAELRRTTIQAPLAGRHSHPAADLYVQARIWNGTARSPMVPMDGDNLSMGERTAPGTYHYFRGGRFSHHGIAYEGEVPIRLREAWRENRRPSAEDWDTFEDNALCLGIPEVDSLDAVEKELLSMLPTAQHWNSWRSLSELPHLFIAV